MLGEHCKGSVLLDLGGQDGFGQTRQGRWGRWFLGHGKDFWFCPPCKGKTSLCEELYFITCVGTNGGPCAEWIGGETLPGGGGHLGDCGPRPTELWGHHLMGNAI